MAKVLGYGRISSGGGQDVTSQKAALEKHGAVVVFTDVGNGSRLEGRDRLEAALRLLDAGDTLLALHPDRIARDTADLLTVARTDAPVSENLGHALPVSLESRPWLYTVL